MFKKITLSFALVAVCALIAMAADLFSGRWDGKLLIGSDETPITYNLKADGAAVTGNIASAQGELPILEGKITGDNSLTFKIDYNGTIIPHEAKISGDTLKMKLTIQDNVIQGNFFRAKQ